MIKRRSHELKLTSSVENEELPTLIHHQTNGRPHEGSTGERKGCEEEELARQFLLVLGRMSCGGRQRHRTRHQVVVVLAGLIWKGHDFRGCASMEREKEGRVLTRGRL